MSLLFRTPVFIARKQPYIDWANGSDRKGPELTVELAQLRTVYLVADPGDTTTWRCCSIIVGPTSSKRSCLAG
jgi:hypothetical protein